MNVDKRTIMDICDRYNTGYSPNNINLERKSTLFLNAPYINAASPLISFASMFVPNSINLDIESTIFLYAAYINAIPPLFSLIINMSCK